MTVATEYYYTALKCFLWLKSQLSSLNFVANRFCVKLFKTSDIQTMQFCRVHVNFELPPSNMLSRRYKQFLDNATTKTDLIKYFCV